MAEQRLLDALVTVLSLCESFGLKFQKIDLDDSPTMGAFAGLIESRGVTAEILLKNKDKICLETEFPVPGRIVEICQEDVDRADPLQMEAYELPPLPGENRPRFFGGKPGMTLEEQEEAWKAMHPPRKVLEMTPEIRKKLDDRRLQDEEE